MDAGVLTGGPWPAPAPRPPSGIILNRFFACPVCLGMAVDCVFDPTTAFPFHACLGERRSLLQQCGRLIDPIEWRRGSGRGVGQ